MTVDLGEFDGRAVRETTIRITNAGDGLSKALKTAPRLLHMGDRVFIVLEAVIGPISHDPIEDSKDVVRKHTAQARTITLVDETLVREVLDSQVHANEALREAESGQASLSAETAREAEHIGGLHKRRRKDCPLCQEMVVEDVAKAERVAAQKREHGDGEGDSENPLPAARKRRSRAKPKP